MSSGIYKHNKAKNNLSAPGKSGEVLVIYSVLSAATGSLFAATFAGISPAMRVSSILMITSITPPCHGNAQIPEISASCSMIIFIGMDSSSVTPMPIAPAAKPTISVSALNTREMSRLDAPIARSMPISFVRSSTDT